MSTDKHAPALQAATVDMCVDKGCEFDSERVHASVSNFLPYKKPLMLTWVVFLSN